MLNTYRLLNGPLEENCYLLSLPGASQGILIDPGSSELELEAAIRKAGIKPVLILATHAHFDHVGAVAALCKAFDAPFAMHRQDQAVLDTVEDMAAFYGLGKMLKPKVSRWLEGGEIVEAAGIKLKAIHTPGHTPGGLCFYHEESQNLFSGDTLFRRSVGRSDFEGGDQGALLKAIREKLFSLPETVKVHPGHGEPTAIGEEKRENPYA